MYTSGSTGKPKGILHTTGGYLLARRTPTGRSSTSSRRPTSTGAPPTSAGSPDTATWSTARSNGATGVIYEGTPDTPEKGRWWKIVQDYKVSIFYTAPTAIRRS